MLAKILLPSSLKSAIGVALFAVTLLSMAMLADAWRSARRDSQKLAAILAAQNNSIQQAADREKQRDAQLAATLSQIQTQKRSVRTPAQAAQNLPSVLPDLPLPISVHIPNLSLPPSQNGPQETTLAIPTPDLLPLYNSLQDCRSTEAQTAALQKDLADEKARSESLQQEKDAALSAARGGTSTVARLKQAAKWFLIGALTSAAIAAVHHSP